MTTASDACISEPISFLRLEHYLQQNLPDAESVRIGDHLRACSVCRACLETMQREVIDLPPLPQIVGRPLPKARWVRWTKPAAALAAAAGVLLILVRDGSQQRALPKSRVQIKGGELAIELVRKHRGAIASDASVYTAGDRFAVRVSCPPDRTARADIVVFDESGASFPLQPVAALRCRNGVTLPGAFEFTGATRATVCVELADQPMDRAHVKYVGPSALGPTSACTTVAPGVAQER
jgi:hypothetical protein